METVNQLHVGTGYDAFVSKLPEASWGKQQAYVGICGLFALAGLSTNKWMSESALIQSSSSNISDILRLSLAYMLIYSQISPLAKSGDELENGVGQIVV